MAPFPTDETRDGASPPSTSAARRTTILVVDDDPALRAIIRRILRPLDLDVFEADTAEAGLAIASTIRGPIDLLLTDVVMPNGNGDALAARLRETRGDLRVLFMSGYGPEVVARHGVTSADFLPKPFTATILRGRVEQALGARSPK